MAQTLRTSKLNLTPVMRPSRLRMKNVAHCVTTRPFYRSCKTVSLCGDNEDLSNIKKVAVSGKPVVVTELTPETFKPYGQVVEWIDDMVEYNEDAAQLDVTNGTPRFYIMRLPARGLEFPNMTHHKKVTQCLGSLSDKPWYMAVAPPGVEEPTEDDVKAFEVPPGKFLKMESGTWHAGPLFVEPAHQDFYNLELADTNQVDHNSSYFESPISIVKENA